MMSAHSSSFFVVCGYKISEKFLHLSSPDKRKKVYTDTMHETKHTRRGYNPRDHFLFSGEQGNALTKAIEEVTYLLDRNYNKEGSIAFVGNHRRLTDRQRLALLRIVCSTKQKQSRIKKSVTGEELKGKTLFIDGFNIIITLETILSSSLILRCSDRLIRDLAGVRGTYRIIAVTEDAIHLMLSSLEALQVHEVFVLLDAPISNSGRLASFIRTKALSYHLNVHVEVTNNVDTMLQNKDFIITADSNILDHVQHYYNLVAHILEHLPYAQIFPTTDRINKDDIATVREKRKNTLN